MPNLAARTPPPVLATDWMKALPPASRFILHGDSQVRAAAGPAWGVAFTDEPCRALVHGSRAALWLGPDEYLLLDLAGESRESADATVNALEGVLGATPHALVDVSHRQFALEISGPHAEVILSGACPLDLSLGEYPVGMCTRTVFAKADIVLWRTRDDVFHIEVWRSFSGYVTGLLGEIAREFYGGR